MDSVKVYLENGSEYITDIASNLTDKQIYSYFKIGSHVNVGIGGKDKITKIKSIKIIRENEYKESENKEDIKVLGKLR